MIVLSNFLGLFGVVITLVAYLLLNIRKLSSQSICYSSMNAIGSSLVIYSLLYAFNLSAFIMEFIWLLISLHGMYQAMIDGKKK